MSESLSWLLLPLHRMLLPLSLEICDVVLSSLTWASLRLGYPFQSRKIERATYEAVPFRFIAGNLHPDHDTLATFRRTFLPELKDLFVQVLLLAKEAGVLKLGTISLDGTKVHADAR